MCSKYLRQGDEVVRWVLRFAVPLLQAHKALHSLKHIICEGSAANGGTKSSSRPEQSAGPSSDLRVDKAAGAPMRTETL